MYKKGQAHDNNNKSNIRALGSYGDSILKGYLIKYILKILIKSYFFLLRKRKHPTQGAVHNLLTSERA